MCKKCSVYFVLFFIPVFLFSQNKYSISVDLNHVKNDKVKVVILTPQITSEEIIYVMPDVIPGSYSQKNYGRFISSFKAYSTKGKKLSVTHSEKNTWTISLSKDKSRTLGRIEYMVDDTWDAEKKEGMSDEEYNYIFQPGGTNINEGKSFVINHEGFYGYLQGYEMLPYEISFSKPDNFFGATSLKKETLSKSSDIYFASNYVNLVDNPILYSIPDTASFISGGTLINIAIFSETHAVSASQIREYLKPIAHSLTKFFVKMPVDHYQFLMYFPANEKSNITQFGGYGALEHSYGSFYFLPELPNEKSFKAMILGVVSHEFLHILTPLNMHSFEIANFDFLYPKMSQHLWMYEGVTEYFSVLVQVRDSLMAYPDFLSEMESKIQEASNYSDVSFTQMSKYILEKEYKGMYNNVYQKGALIGLLLDIRLNELSDGKLSLRDLMMKLKDKYGPERPFNDDDLINDIVAFSYPEIRTYFNDFVIGNKHLPYKEYLEKIGLNYYDVKQDTILTFGKFGLTFSETEAKFKISNTEGSNSFKLKDDDNLLTVNDRVITLQNYTVVLGPLFTIKDQLPVKIKYSRNGEVIEVEAIPYKDLNERKMILEENPNATKTQIALRKKLLYSVSTAE